MSSFWDSFKSKVRSWLPAKKTEEVAKAPEYEKKTPKYLYSKKLNPDFNKGFNTAMRANFKGGNKSLTIHYTKANGEKVKRTVTPYTAKGGNVIVGYDHKRGALRSFRVDRVSKLES